MRAYLRTVTYLLAILGTCLLVFVPYVLVSVATNVMYGVMAFVLTCVVLAPLFPPFADWLDRWHTGKG
jgi:hypothetical protein